ncbi:Ammar1 transposase [Vespula squamosa]|uniref:Ammar1 transposase n=1 Tax=Vespula squamosa TaxID=30214 RepID=A0ABD2BHB0_VESSQ
MSKAYRIVTNRIHPKITGTRLECVNSLKNKIFNDADDVKSPLIQFFASKNQKFYEHGIMTV